jgi:hypothetical protein
MKDGEVFEADARSDLVVSDSIDDSGCDRKQDDLERFHRSNITPDFAPPAPRQRCPTFEMIFRAPS